MRKLKIADPARFLLREAFKQDVEYELHPQSFYLDLSTGRVTFVYESDEDASFEMGISPEKNQEERLLVESDPDRFLLIPGLSHADHHVILLDFLSSDRMHDEESGTRAEDAYSGSIGRWKKTIRQAYDEETEYAYYNYRDERIDEMINEFLRQNGIEPEYLD